jgi:branched-chain amino acid transport system substrate-binding protein
MFKRTSVLLALLLIASLVLSACGGTSSAKVIKIATQSPLSGGQSLLGVDIKNGAQLALEQLSGPLTEMGFTVELAPMTIKQPLMSVLRMPRTSWLIPPFCAVSVT